MPSLCSLGDADPANDTEFFVVDLEKFPGVANLTNRNFVDDEPPPHKHQHTHTQTHPLRLSREP